MEQDRDTKNSKTGGPVTGQTSGPAGRQAGQPGQGGQSGQGGGGSDDTGYTAKVSALGSEAAEQVSRAARKTRRSAGRAVRSLAADAGEQVETLADRQIDYGADLVAKFAEAVRAASDVIEDDLPPLANLGYGTAEQIDDFADTVREQSAGDLLGAVTEVARRRPAILLGAAAASGFILYRLVNAAARAEAARPHSAGASGNYPAARPQAMPESAAGASPARPSPAASRPSPAAPRPAPVAPRPSPAPARPSGSGQTGGGNGA